MTASLVGKCPAGCGRPVKTGHLLCGPCWRSVPTDLQRQVQHTYARYRRAMARVYTSSPESITYRQDARDAYRNARDAAIGSVR